MKFTENFQQNTTGEKKVKPFARVVSLMLVMVLLVVSSSCGNNNYDYNDYNYGELTSEYAITSEESTAETSIEENTETIDSGILVLNVKYGNAYKYNSTGTMKRYAFTATLDLIDPDNGKVKNLKTFTTESTHSCIFGEGLHNGWDSVECMMLLSDDYSKLVAAVTSENGDQHIGWIDEQGLFTDVSSKVEVKNDFSGITRHSSPRFGPNGYFYFKDTTSDACVKRVPINNLSSSSVETVAVLSYDGEDYRINPDGTVNDDGWDYYDSNMNYPARHALINSFHDWLSENECIGTIDDSANNNSICRYKLSGEKDISDWYSEKTPIVPRVKGRKNYNPVVSPNKDKVAFLSIITGSDLSPYLYVVSLDGGEPKKIATNYSFLAYNTYPPEQIVLIDWI